jgi:hypothetical protein
MAANASNKGTQILQATYNGAIFRDTYNFTGAALKKFVTMFDLGIEMVKGYCPFDFVKTCNLEYVG